ncbi:MAG: hypothetical protein EOO75_10300 [Myxococcales bacterium]|nr:MAG: hypothetical protein EOO75_10300 [Myxococcales bacterium]
MAPPPEPAPTTATPLAEPSASPAPGGAVATAAPVAPAAASSAPPPAAPATAELSGESKGEASFYSTDGKGSCSLNPPPNRMILAASKDVYQSAQACGACLEVSGGAGKMVVQVMDLCFTCPPGHLVLSKPAFEATVGKNDGKGPITWRTVPCEVPGKVAVRIKESSSRSWTAVQIRDSKLPLQLVEMKREGESDWVKLTRSADNYWAMAKGAGDDGFRVRITASNGQQIEEAVARGWKDGKVYPGASQF